MVVFVPKTKDVSDMGPPPCPRKDGGAHKPLDEITSRIAAARNTNGHDFRRDDGGPRTQPLTEGYVRKGGRNDGESQIKERPAPPAPLNKGPAFTISWSPTIGRPAAANSGVNHLLDENGVFWADGADKYKTLSAILDAAFNHAATGKGKERHARDLPFDKQPMLETTRLVGPGFPLGQSIKKAGEAAGMISRKEYDAAEAECLGAINYLAGAVAWMREQKTAPTSVGAAA